MLQFTQSPNSPRRRGLFGGGTTPQPPDQAAPMQPQLSPMDTYQRIDAISAPQQQAPKSSGGKINWAGLAADFLAGMNGQQGPYLAQMQAEKKRAADDAEYNRQRMDKRDDWMWQQDYERANPKPTNNDTVADYDYILSKLGPEKANEYLQNKANPPVWRQGDDQQWYRMDTGAAPAMPKPVQIDPQDWDSAPVVGGASGSPAGGGFPRR